MRVLTALIALSIAPMAMAQNTPCQDAATFSARGCAQQVQESLETAASSRDTIASMAECTDTKKKKVLMQCAADYNRALRQLGRSSRILAAAYQASQG